MALTATPARRRAVMIALLLLAVAGAVIRKLAPNPSTLRDIGTLLLVMWLPAVGNLIAYLVRKMPRRAPAPAPADNDFPAQAAFTPHLRVRLQSLLAPGEAGPEGEERRCTVLLGQQAFTARLEQPLAATLAPADADPAGGPQEVRIELLRPELALPRLPPGTEFHLLAGRNAVAKGRVIEAQSAASGASVAQ
jgi:hypothetical protein